ncbi:bifunctional adenosylcobinamide kinase/adenosylcobinamide-phosphate guanylyltransferase [Sedimentibacter sp. zth1]|uniref:bifunctional adenosylcobinamide kinase/adenosylcobinamide-phosphate guanylyltransferase n=1 Tax=Sedimentibacter sp. zth1 TaxID=2816908 RepID=UPI001A90E897|nr:bifunctional adenosylcobinamide kinase/adenosylcobinamide-phosphate guanylyltransferase [Sedimentibacter sp. zth1]QSX06603.1 bifunctional adenosylcobinamide kinase/adenosylcobinamide-phosphate guanylyltransferase [Sedimentibacter sp. zth1]
MCVTLVVGGARSGKSSFAENKAKEYGKNIAYIATSVVTDKSMADRVKKHREQRPNEWKTIETYKNFNTLIDNNDFLSSDTIMIDCITTLICNFMVDSKIDFDNCLMKDVNKLEATIKHDILDLIHICKDLDKHLVIVSNEVGLGVVPAYYMGNFFRDISGRMNAFIAKESDNVYFTVSGIPMKLKSKGVNIHCSEDY